MGGGGDGVCGGEGAWDRGVELFLGKPGPFSLGVQHPRSTEKKIGLAQLKSVLKTS